MEEQAPSTGKAGSPILNWILFLCVIGLLASIYLVQSHYAKASGTWCDLSETISCSAVNASSFSVMFNVPVALFGALWFLFLILMVRKDLKSHSLHKLIFWWSIAGALFVAYFVAVEFYLKAICPTCTLVHIILLVLLFLSYQHLKGKVHPFEHSKILKRWAIGIALTYLVVIILFSAYSSEPENYDELAKCITEKGINMYGSYRCGACEQQKELLGEAFQYISEVECHPSGPDSQWERCQKKNIDGTPTWIMEPDNKEVKRHEGAMSIAELEEFSGCQ